MATFTVRGFSDLARDMVSGDLGYIADGAELVVSNEDAVDAAGAIRVVVNGDLVSLSTSLHRAFDWSGSVLDFHVGASGSVQSSGGVALRLSGEFSCEIKNMGSIVADLNAIEFAASDGEAFFNLVNHGIIAGGAGVVADAGAAQLILLNSGVISGDLNPAANFSAHSGSVSVVNTGQMFASHPTAYSGGSGRDRFVNSGEIVGDVLLGLGNDRFDGRAGALLGKVWGDLGEDVILGSAFGDELHGGNDDDVLRGEGGGDLIFGGTGDDLLAGGAGEDEMEGGDGVDLLRGGEGGDLISGGLGHDELRGGGGDDELDGQGGRDFLRGHWGEDVLRGGASPDVLDGGADDDVLAGGKGADRFVFRRKGGDDRVLDFENGVDAIDLTAFGLRPAQYGSEVAPALSSAGAGATFLDLAKLGGSGSVLIEGLNVGDADASDFLL